MQGASPHHTQIASPRQRPIERDSRCGQCCVNAQACTQTFTINLFATGGHSATVDHHAAARIGRQARQRLAVAAHGRCQGRDACAVEGQVMCTVDQAAQGERGGAAAQRQVVIQHHSGIAIA